LASILSFGYHFIDFFQCHYEKIPQFEIISKNSITFPTFTICSKGFVHKSLNEIIKEAKFNTEKLLDLNKYFKIVSSSGNSLTDSNT